MSSGEKFDTLPGYSPATAGLTAYHITLTMYESVTTSKGGIHKFQDFVDQSNNAITLSPDSTWRDVRARLWNMIADRFTTINRAESQQYSVGLSVKFTTRGDKEVQTASCAGITDSAFFGLFARNDITVIKLTAGFAHRFGSTTQHLEGLGLNPLATILRHKKKSRRCVVQ